MSQEGSISETLLEILKLLAGGGLYWQESSWCGAPCAVQSQDTGRLITCNKNKH
jgi:hypothetical protein